MQAHQIDDVSYFRTCQVVMTFGQTQVAHRLSAILADFAQDFLDKYLFEDSSFVMTSPEQPLLFFKNVESNVCKSNLLES